MNAGRPGLPVVTLYTGGECGLCDVAKAELESLAPKLQFQLEVVSIDGDTRLRAEYASAVPVVALGETEIARAPIRPGTLEPKLASALSQVRSNGA